MTSRWMYWPRCDERQSRSAGHRDVWVGRHPVQCRRIVHVRVGQTLDTEIISSDDPQRWPRLYAESICHVCSAQKYATSLYSWYQQVRNGSLRTTTLTSYKQWRRCGMGTLWPRTMHFSTTHYLGSFSCSIRNPLQSLPWPTISVTVTRMLTSDAYCGETAFHHKTYVP